MQNQRVTIYRYKLWLLSYGYIDNSVKTTILIDGKISEIVG
jgi:hypothetical protein